jgi:hypothetical protein
MTLAGRMQLTGAALPSSLSFFHPFFDKLRIFSTSIDATVFVLDCFLELTLVGSSKDLAIIHSDTILVAEG